MARSVGRTRTQPPEGPRADLCDKCGANLRAACVAHPIHDGPFPGSGSGKCAYDEMLYCPKCEDKPAYHGTPIQPN